MTDRLQMLRDHVQRCGVSTEHMMKMLSDDAKAVAGGCFGGMWPGHGELRFEMRKNRPTARSQAALDELEAMGAIEVTKELGGAVRYRALVNFRQFYLWLGRRTNRADLRFKIVEPIEPAGANGAHQL
ncbi:hypothetical protein ACVIGB_000536 [Bradyrhizobium sp. USDA 4341]